MNLDIQIGQLAEYIEEYKDVKLQHNEELDIKDLQCQIETPTGNSVINYIIKKENLSGIKITLKSGIEVKCAKKHILQSNGDVYADKLSIGDTIETKTGTDEIINISKISDVVFYDIGIDAPYLYYDSDGVLHHNTLITAALSKMTEKFGRSIVIVPNRDLVTQTEADYKNLGLDVGVFYGGRNEWNKTHTICTWQSLDRLDKKTKEHLTDEEIGDFLDGVKCIMVDECFDQDTLITMADGNKKKIKDINIGDNILNYSEETNIFKADTVVDIYKNMSKSSNEKMYKLEFDKGVVEVTGNHKFLTQNRGWVRADELTEDDNIIDNC